ncbi:MAG: dicarboxylate/amino acid:cation symporter [Candidatus Binatia bacterium]
MARTRRAWYRQLHWQILLGMALGLVFGGVLGERVRYVQPLGVIFLRLLRMVIVPLIFSSLIVGITGLGGAASVGRMGVKTLAYYTATSSAAIFIGLLAVNLIRPGVGANLPLAATPAGVNLSAGRLGDTLLGIIPDNPLAAMAQGNILAIIFFALLVGLFTNRLPPQGRGIIVSLMQAVFDLMMLITDVIIRLAPIGVFALMAGIVGTTGVDAFVPLFKYMLTVTVSLAVHALVTLPLLLVVFGRTWPPTYARAVAPALATAFSTASSSATLPVTLDTVERRGGIPNQVSAFVLPLGATVNMDGTALYECVAVIFIAQAYGISLGVGQQFVVFVTALLASIGAAGIPMAGLVMMAIVLRAVGLPLEGVGLILAVDRVLDMCRTSVNVWSDTVGAAVIARWEGLNGPRGENSPVSVVGD